MPPAARAIVLFSAVNGFLAVAFGAFAAHAASDPAAAAWLRTGGTYQLLHAGAAMACANRSRPAAWAMNLGAAVFAFTLYALAFGAPRAVGAVTPLGGALMLCGWALLGWAAIRRASAHEGLDG